ncbi:MAG: DUF427 domain-containing protein [Pseudomonadota bacterium]
MAKAIWNGVVIAESDVFETVEGNVYFPPDAVKQEYLKASDHTSHCPWKGDASYYTLAVNGEKNKDAAWYYPTPFEKAAHIKDHVAFWKGVTVEQ